MPPTVSGCIFVCGNDPFGTLERGKVEGNPWALLRDSLSAIATATRDAWSVPVPMENETDGEFSRREASGSFSI